MRQSPQPPGLQAHLALGGCKLDEAEALELARVVVFRETDVHDFAALAEGFLEGAAHRTLALAAVKALHEDGGAVTCRRMLVSACDAERWEANQAGGTSTCLALAGDRP